jgi:hypothetical protein
MIKTKKLIGLVIALTLLTPSVAFASIKSGSKCTVQNQTKISDGKKYKCIRSGKKLVWNKATLIVIPIVSSTPSPTPSPTQTEAPAQIPVGLWQETQFKILAQFKQLKPTSIQELTFVLSPNADKVLAKQLQESYQEPITYLSNLYVNPAKVTFLVMNENDRDWWVLRLNELSSTMASDWWDKGHCYITKRVQCGYGSAPSADGTFHFGQVLGSEMNWTEKNYTIAYHESIHVYQLGLMGNRMSALPFWFAEGQANYLGFTFSNRFIDSKTQRKAQILRVFSIANADKYNDTEWAEWLKKIDSDSGYTFSNELGYSIGELILESLYNQYDFRKVHDWMVAIKNGSDYKTGFKSTFGQDYDSWLRDTAASYLNSQI